MHGGQGADEREVGRRVDDEGPGGADLGVEDAADGGPDDPGQVHVGGVEGDGPGEVLAFDQRGDQGRERRRVERLPDAAGQDGDEERPDPGVVDMGQPGDDQRHEGTVRR